MAWIDDLLRRLFVEHPATCSGCGSVLVAIAGPDGLGASICTTCDPVPAASLADRSPTVDHDEHWSPIAGCADCADEAFTRRARVIEPRSYGAQWPGGPRL